MKAMKDINEDEIIDFDKLQSPDQNSSANSNKGELL